MKQGDENTQETRSTLTCGRKSEGGRERQGKEKGRTKKERNKGVAGKWRDRKSRIYHTQLEKEL